MLVKLGRDWRRPSTYSRHSSWPFLRPRILNRKVLIVVADIQLLVGCMFPGHLQMLGIISYVLPQSAAEMVEINTLN